MKVLLIKKRVNSTTLDHFQKIHAKKFRNFFTQCYFEHIKFASLETFSIRTNSFRKFCLITARFVISTYVSTQSSFPTDLFL